jgi:hypothetical protein
MLAPNNSPMAFATPDTHWLGHYRVNWPTTNWPDLIVTTARTVELGAVVQGAA